jgi:cysteine desulfurase / selenocysteine lyase
VDLSSYRADFPITEQYAFLSHASFSPYNRRVTDAISEHLLQVQRGRPDQQIAAILALGQQLRERAAQLINAAQPGEIVPMPDTATGINTAANSLPLRPGDNVLIVEGDYPANVYPWLNLAPRGVLTKWVPQHMGGVDLERLTARIDNRTRVIAVSSAMFATGFRNDLAAIGALCRERGIFFVVDAIQTLGAFPIDVQACGIDFLAAGGQKWLLSTPGSGLLYVRGEIMDELQPGAYVGATSVVDPVNFLDYNFTLQPTADRFTLGTPNLLNNVALHAALGLLLEVGIERIAGRIIELTDRLIAGLQERGFTILSNLDSQHRSGILIVEVDEPEQTAARLAEAGVITTPRGAGLRFAPHFYNNETDIDRALDALGRR